MKPFDAELNALKDRKAKVLHIQIGLDPIGQDSGVDEELSMESPEHEAAENPKATPEHPDAPQDAKLFKDMMAEHASEEAAQMKEEAAEGGEQGSADEMAMQKQAMGGEDADSIIEQYSKRPAGTLGEKVKLALAQKMKAGKA